MRQNKKPMTLLFNVYLLNRTNYPYNEIRNFRENYLQIILKYFTSRGRRFECFYITVNYTKTIFPENSIK